MLTPPDAQSRDQCHRCARPWCAGQGDARVGSAQSECLRTNSNETQGCVQEHRATGKGAPQVQLMNVEVQSFEQTPNCLLRCMREGTFSWFLHLVVWRRRVDEKANRYPILKVDHSAQLQAANHLLPALFSQHSSTVFPLSGFLGTIRSFHYVVSHVAVFNQFISSDGRSNKAQNPHQP